MTLRTLVILLAMLSVNSTFSVGNPSQEGRKTEQPLHRLPASAQDICPRLVGATIPTLTLTTVNGRPFDLNEAIAKKPTVLIFYRGGW